MLLVCESGVCVTMTCRCDGLNCCYTCIVDVDVNIIDTGCVS